MMTGQVDSEGTRVVSSVQLTNQLIFLGHTSHLRLPQENQAIGHVAEIKTSENSFTITTGTDTTQHHLMSIKQDDQQVFNRHH